MKNIVQDFRLEHTGAVREYSNMGGQIIVDLHETQSDKAVKPCVGNLFHHLHISLRPDLIDKLLTLPLLIRCQSASTYGHGVLFAVTVFGNSVLISSLRYLSDQLSTRPYRKSLYCAFIHCSVSFS